MPTFLSDPPTAEYALFLVAIAIAGAMWWNRRTRATAISFAAAIALTALVYSIDRLFESPREESVRRVLAMARAADTRDTEAFLSNIADSFQYQGESAVPRTITKEQLRQSVIWEILRQHNVHVAAWDFDTADVVQIDDNNIEIGFLAKGEADSKPLPIYLRARFTRQPDGQMKLTSLASFDPVKRTNERLAIPYLP